VCIPTQDNTSNGYLGEMLIFLAEDLNIQSKFFGYSTFMPRLHFILSFKNAFTAYCCHFVKWKFYVLEDSVEMLFR